MKINSISSFNYNSNNINFKRTAVPYPEYQCAYFKQQSGNNNQGLLDKIIMFFSPSIKDESDKIKSGIDSLYSDKTVLNNANPKAQLMSVLA